MKKELLSRFLVWNRSRRETYRLESYLFGREWGIVKTPVRAVVGAIDDFPESEQEARVGLSAKQIRNLGLFQLQVGNNDAHALRRMVLRNTEGLTDDRVFSQVTLEYEGKGITCNVYNAFGRLSQSGPHVRVSMRVASELGLKTGSKIGMDVLLDVPVIR